MAGNGKPVRITVVLGPEGAKPPFYLCSNDITVGPDNEIVFANKEHPGFLIFFDLDNSKNPRYFFPNTPEAALWSKTEDSSGCCPAKWQHWEQFMPKAVHKVQGQNRTLIVRNINGFEKRFGYTLRVTKTPNDDFGDFLDLDPGGTNTNGPTTTKTSNYIAVGVGTLAFAAYSAYAFGLFGASAATGSYAAVALGTIAFAAFAAYAFGLFGR